MRDNSKITNIRVWLNCLVDFLKKNIAASKEVVVIALSRKMPRFIEYLINCSSSELTSQLQELLSDRLCTYTTEHAIPFVFRNYPKDAAILILDDIIVRGTTLSNVSEEIYHLTENEPKYLSICQFDQFEGLSVGQPLDGYTPQIVTSMEEVREILLEISRCIKSNGLPIDMEFPILHTDSGDSYAPIVEQMKLHCPTSRHYSNDWSFTILQEDEINRMYNNDFAKIRVFKELGDTRIVGYAPNVLSESELSNESLFINSEYSSLWDLVLQNTVSPSFAKDDIILSDNDNRKAKVTHRIYKSLAVLANYLFSLSMLIRHRQEFDIEGVHPEIRRSDLQLLVGEKLCDILLPRLSEFIVSGSNSQSERRFVNTPPYLIPYYYEDDDYEDYDMERFVAVFNAEDLFETVNNVFTASYDMFDQEEGRDDYMVWTGGKNLYYLESFQSLFQLPLIEADESASEMEINEIVDNLIDEGRLIPVYERTTDQEDPYIRRAYWRRYFKASHTINRQ